MRLNKVRTELYIFLQFDVSARALLLDRRVGLQAVRGSSTRDDVIRSAHALIDISGVAVSPVANVYTRRACQYI
jgi:hypothetical protein